MPQKLRRLDGFVFGVQASYLEDRGTKHPYGASPASLASETPKRASGEETPPGSTWVPLSPLSRISDKPDSDWKGDLREDIQVSTHCWVSRTVLGQ